MPRGLRWGGERGQRSLPVTRETRMEGREPEQPSPPLPQSQSQTGEAAGQLRAGAPEMGRKVWSMQSKLLAGERGMASFCFRAGAGVLLQVHKRAPVEGADAGLGHCREGQ